MIRKDTKETEPKIKIVKMTKQDLPALLKFGKEQWPDDDWLTMSYLKASFVQPGSNYVAKIGDKVIGGVIMVYEDIEKNWIRYLIVSNDYRKQGIGRKLLEKMYSKLPIGESVFVDTGVSDKKAILFYEKLGFKNRGMVRSFYGNMPAYFFEKNIR